MKLWIYPLIFIIISSIVLAATVIGPFATVNDKTLVIEGSSTPYVVDVDGKWKKCDDSLLSYQNIGNQLIFNVGGESFVINYTYTTKNKVKIDDKNADYVDFNIHNKECGFYYTQNFTDKKGKLDKDDSLDYLEYTFPDGYAFSDNKVKKGELVLDLNQAVFTQNITILYNSTTKKLKLSGEQIGKLDPDLTVFTSQTLCGVQTYDNVIINNSAVITLCDYTGDVLNGSLIFNVANFTMGVGSVINGTEKGYQANGDGPGTGGSTGGGGGYGGVGGHTPGRTDGGPTYGSTTNVTQMGSGGYGSTTLGDGGGYIKINATNFLNMSGSITSKGENGQGNYGTLGSGAGSGGGVWLLSKTITGTGSIDVSGGNGVCGGGGCSLGPGGGGGRIYVQYCTNSSATYTLSSLGGSGWPTLGDGNPGTVAFGTLPTATCSVIIPTPIEPTNINEQTIRVAKFNRNKQDMVSGFDSAIRSIVFANVTFIYSFTPNNPIPFNSSGYGFSFNWNASGGSLDKYFVNLTYSNGTNILQSTSFNISLANYTLDNYYAILWANISNGVVSTITEPWSITDQYLPTYNNFTLSSSPYYNGYNLNIYVNTTDTETNISSVKVNLRDQNNINYLNAGGGGVLSSGLWVITYAPAVNGLWTIYSIEIRDAYNNLLNITPGTTFNVVTYVAPTPPSGGGGSTNPPVVSGTNLTFSLTPTQTDVIVIKGDETFIPIKISSTSPGTNTFRVLVNDQCGVFKNWTTTKDKTNDYYTLNAFEDMVFKFRMVFPPDFNKDGCKLVITFEGSNSFSRSTTVNLINTPFGYLLKRVVTILYYPLAFDDEATKIEFLTPTMFAVFPAAKSLTIPFFGTLIIVLFFFVIRFFLFVAFKGLRTNKRMLFLLSSGLIILPIALMYKSFNFSILANNVWIGVGFILVVVAIIAGTFRLPRFSSKK